MNLPHNCARPASTLVLRIIRNDRHTQVSWYCPQCHETGTGFHPARPRLTEANIFPPYDH